MKISKQDFEPVLRKVHNTFWKKAYQKLSRKISSLKGSLKKRAEDSNLLFDVELEELKQLFLDNYGEECKYCSKKLSIYNIACDHIIPVAKGGDSTIKNLQLICGTCNRRKGHLDEKDFVLLIQLVQELPEELCSYVMKKLAKGGRY